jgi:deoxyhypusine synthase
MIRKDYFKKEIEHIDIKKFNSITIIEQYDKTAFQAKNLAGAAKLYHRMLEDKKCTIILCLAGSLFSAGLKKIVHDLVYNNMVDVIVSTGAIIVDQDFFEALGFRHYQGTYLIDDNQLMKRRIDRIYDTFIDEDQLRICDMTIAKIADNLPVRAYSSREFIKAMGKYLATNRKIKGSVVGVAHKKELPVFVPAFSDSSAGFGLVYHQWHKKNKPKVVLDSVKDFLELTKLKVASKETGLLMIGGGVPKNFAQDITVAADILGQQAKMHKYAVQITVADERDGGLSGSTLKEAHSWGKVNSGNEQMVFSEASIAFPLIASYAYHKGSWKNRRPKMLNKILDKTV